MNNKVKYTGIVIPTFNAKPTIVNSIKEIKKHSSSVIICIVDDNSPDKTADAVTEAYGNDHNVLLIKRQGKGGRGSAVLDGFKELLKNSKIEYFIEMDADLCHNPKYIYDLVDKCRNADVVIASRYLPKSKIYNWNAKRKLMSFAINTFAKAVLRIPISDYTDGFRCYSRRAIEIITNYTVKSRGYIVLSETAYICHKKGLTFDEVPIDFHFKADTKSNLNLKEVKEALRIIISLPFTNYEKSDHNIE